MLTRCASCNKLLLLRQKFRTTQGTLCLTCNNAREERLKRHEQNKRKRALEQRKRREENKRLAEQRLREELEQKAKKARKTPEKPSKEENIKPASERPHTNQPKEETGFTRSDIESNRSLLLIEADVKRLKVTEWIDSKPRIVLNKEREVRRTHAGGFSAEKFQRFVDSKKKKALEWLIANLEKPGVLRTPYEKTKVVAADPQMQEALESYIESVNTSV